MTIYEINSNVRTQRANWATWQTEAVLDNAVGDLSEHVGGVDVPDEIYRPVEQAIYALGAWVEANTELLKRKHAERVRDRRC